MVGLNVVALGLLAFCAEGDPGGLSTPLILLDRASFLPKARDGPAIQTAKNVRGTQCHQHTPTSIFNPPAPPGPPSAFWTRHLFGVLKIRADINKDSGRQNIWLTIHRITIIYS